MNTQIKTWYVVSDIHGFYKELIKALRVAGYNKKDPTKGIIILGDLFDRGSEALEVYNYIRSIPKKRRILIKGNHESLYKELLIKDYPEEYDFHNGTVKTFCQIAGMTLFKDNTSMESFLEKGLSIYYGMFSDTVHIDPLAKEFWNQICNKVKNHPVTKWINSKEWLDYYEINNKYIMVHSFIPTILEYGSTYSIHSTKKPMLDWRSNATNQDWENARWGCPWKDYTAGLFEADAKANKVLVCGHWHTSDFYRYLAFDRSGCQDIFCGSNIIAIDGGITTTYDNGPYCEPCLHHYQNVLIIKDDLAIDGKDQLVLTDMTAQPYEITQDQNSYWLPENTSMFDICHCGADCKTACGRKLKTGGIHTVSDFSSKCSKYIKGDNLND